MMYRFPNENFTILYPCRTQVEFVWSNIAQKGGINRNRPRMGATDFAASTSCSVNLARAPSQKDRPGWCLAVSAHQETLKKPALFVLRLGGTMVYCFLPSQKTNVAMAINIPGTRNAALYPLWSFTYGITRNEKNEPRLMDQ